MATPQTPTPSTAPAPSFLPRRLLDVAEASTVTGLPHRTIRGMFDRRELPLVRVGSRGLRVWSTDLEAHLTARTIPAEGVTR